MSRGPAYRVLMGIAMVAMLACRDASRRLIPDTPLGKVANAWLDAHNDGGVHAIVHFRTANRGTAVLSRDQSDVAVRDAMQLAKDVGALTPVQLLKSTDSSLAIRTKAADGQMWDVGFTPARQPAALTVRLLLGRAKGGE